MDKHELAVRLARRSSQSRSTTADKLDALIYKLWKEAKELALRKRVEKSREISSAPVEKNEE